MSAPQSLAVRAAIGALALASLVADPASAFPVTLDPSAVGLNGSAFSADALKAQEVSRIAIDSGSGAWTEHGYAYITEILSGSNLAVPSGLGTDYTLYLDFQGTGTLASNVFETATMILYGVKGASVFGIDASNNATVTHAPGQTPIVLATSGLIRGTTGGVPGEDLSADLLTTFELDSANAAFFVDPAGFLARGTVPLSLYGSFFHAAAYNELLTDGIVVRGGNDTLTFVPEPASLALLVAGLAGLRRTRRAAVAG